MRAVRRGRCIDLNRLMGALPTGARVHACTFCPQAEHMHRFVNRARFLADVGSIWFLYLYKHHSIRAYAPDRIGAHASVCKQGEVLDRSGFCTNVTASDQMHRIASKHMHRFVNRARCWIVLVFVQTSQHHSIRAYAPDRIGAHASVCKSGDVLDRSGFCICINVTASAPDRIGSRSMLLIPLFRQSPFRRFRPIIQHPYLG